MAKTKSGRRTLSTGPFTGVQNTQQPYDDTPNKLVDATNIYIPDPSNGSEVLARPGYTLIPFPATGTGQAVFTHIDSTGTVYNLMVVGGVIYRVNGALSTYAAVTSVSGYPIDPTSRVYFTSILGQLVVSDGVHRPWVAGNLAGPLWTVTYIDFDGAGTEWTAFGQPEVFAGSIFFVINSVGGVLARGDVAWSGPADPTIGYQQPNYDYRWTLQQTGSGNVNGLKATNVALYYFRASSIGAITGTPGPDLQQTATHDVVSVNVGALQSATIQLFGDKIFFCDVEGKPWMFQVGGGLQPIWQQMRTAIANSTHEYPTVTAAVATATIIPDLNLYAAAIWSPIPGTVASPTEAHIFDANTGIYLGRWSFATGTPLDAIGTWIDTAGSATLGAITSAFAAPTNPSRYPMIRNRVSAGIVVTTEAGDSLTTEAGVILTTEAQIVSWMDGAFVPAIAATTQRFGYSSDTVWNVDQGSIVTGTPTPCRVSATTPTSSNVVEGTPTPATSDDGTYRLVFGADVQGRGLQLTIAPTTATEQWSLYSASALMVPSLAGPEEA